MRVDPPGSRITARTRDPRVVVGIIFPTSSIYLTNRGGYRRIPLVNAGLESGSSSGWLALDGTVASASGGHAGSTYYARIQNLAGGPNGIMGAVDSPPVGATVRITAYARRDESSLPSIAQSLAVRFYDSGDVLIGARQTVGSPSTGVVGWQLVQGSTTVPASARFMRIDVGEGGSGTGHWHWDDMQADLFTGIANVPGVVVHGALTELSTTSQEIVPEEARSTIGNLSFTVVDLLGAVTDELRDQLLVELRGVRGREVRVYTGDTDNFTDGTWQRVETYVVDNLPQPGRSYSFSCSDRKREQRVDVFDQQKTRLASTLTASATSVVVNSTSGFSMLAHNAAYSDAPSSTVGYIRIAQTGEIIRYTGTSGGNTFTGCTRAVFNTVAQECVVDGALGVDRRPEVEEFIYLEGPPAVIDYAINTGSVLENLVANGGGEIGTVGSLATSWTLGAGNNLVVATDQSRVGARCLKITNAAATDSRSYQDVTLVGGLRYRLEGLIRTSAMPTADAGLGAFFNADIQSGITSYTIHEKSTIGADPEATTPTCGIAADGVAHDWTYVYSEFTPLANGTMRLNCQLGIGNQSGTAWFDGVRVRRVDQMPAKWHMGIDETLVDSYAYEQLGADLYNPADVTAGLVLRFTHLEKTDGKRFCEEQLHLPMQTFAPIDANGVIGIKRLTPVLADATPSVALSSNNVISIEQMEHALNRVVNRVAINWNFDGERYTRRDVFIHAGSIAKHGEGRRILEYSLRGLTVNRHTRATLQRMVDTTFERLAAPPIEIDAKLSRTVNALEVGDTPRMAMPSVRDFTAAATLDRVFEQQSRRINWLTGELHAHLFASTERIAPDAGGGTGAILSDSWYNSTGTQLSTVLTMVGNTVTANGNLPAGTYYHLGDLTIQAGVTVTINGTVQLRVRGAPTFNGTFDGTGRGTPGLACPDVVSQAANYPAYGAYFGFFGSSQSSDGVYQIGSQFYNRSGHGQLGQNSSAPRIALSVASGTLLGLPADVSGVRGAWGAPVSSNFFANVVAKGGDGGGGGAGLIIVSRGPPSFGASGAINLSGGNGTVPPATGVVSGVTLYGGAGAGGSPGCLYVILDGDNVTYPDLSAGFIADQGSTPRLGTPAEYAAPGSITITFPTQPGTGVGAGFSGEDHFSAAHVVQYVPSNVAIGPADETVPAPTALAALVSDVGVQLTWTSPPADKHDFIEVWRATTNDRTGAVRVFRGRADTYFETSATAVTRYFWIRAGSDRLGFSEWQPTGSTSGVSARYGGVLAVNQWTPVLVNVTRDGSRYTKTGGVDSTFDASVYSAEGYTRAAIQWKASQTNKTVDIGFDTDPSAAHTRAALEYAMVMGSDGNLYYNQSGSVGALGVSYTTTDLLTLIYDGTSVRYYKNSTLIGVIAVASPNAVLYLDSSFYETGAAIYELRFWPVTSVGTNQIDPEGASAHVISESAADVNLVVSFGAGTFGPVGSASFVVPTGETYRLSVEFEVRFTLGTPSVDAAGQARITLEGSPIQETHSFASDGFQTTERMCTWTYVDDFTAGTWDFGIEARETSGGVTKLHSTVKIAGHKR